MAALYTPLEATGHSEKGYAQVSYSAAYDAETNKTMVRFDSAIISCGALGSNIDLATLTIRVEAVDNSGSMALARIQKGGSSATIVDTPSPQAVTVEHGSDDASKTIVITLNVTATVRPTLGGLIHAQGSASETIVVERVSIIHVGDEVGALYVAMNGVWHEGVPCAVIDGQFHAGVGYIFLVPESEEGYGEVTVTYDEEGNVYLSGVGMTHDNAGNVLLSGVTATDDGDGNITIT